MNNIRATTDIRRVPDDVFTFIADPTRIPEWQPDVRAATFDGSASPGVGSGGHEVRHVMGRDRKVAWIITAYEPGVRFALEGVEGPVRAHVTMDLSPTADGSATSMAYAIGFRGHGIGRLLAPLARKGVQRDLPETLQRLKGRLEGVTV